MSIATQLGLDEPEQGCLGQAHDWWGKWVRSRPALGVVDELASLPLWMTTADLTAREGVLESLSELAATHGDDGLAGAAALTWILLPGACRLAHGLRGLTRQADELVAAQLWIEVRTFGRGRGRRVAATILWNTRNGVLRDVGISKHAEPAWRLRILMEPEHPAWKSFEAVLGTESQNPDELGELLADACAAGAIGVGDSELLVGLARAAHTAAPAYQGHGRAGLMTPVATAQAATCWGVSPRTVRRRARRSLNELARYASPKGPA